MITRGQNSNEAWYLYRKGVITGSKGNEVITKMKKVKKGGGGYANLWQLFQKVSGLVFVNPSKHSCFKVWTIYGGKCSQ